jgi:hypothetical protein
MTGLEMALAEAAAKPARPASRRKRRRLDVIFFSLVDGIESGDQTAPGQILQKRAADLLQPFSISSWNPRSRLGMWQSSQLMQCAH